ncbi:MAG: hypothetical protein KDD55_11390, partial [Bdellovibrionales bacterium]|nr:hypothetical protein [Bdellovibrionales bacterium]
IKLLINNDISVRGAKVAVLGITFKENVPDIRNSRVPDIIRELKEYGCSPIAHDPYASPEEVEEEYGVSLCSKDELNNLDAVILAVSHKAYMEDNSDFDLFHMVSESGIVLDVKAVLDRNTIPKNLTYWAL